MNCDCPDPKLSKRTIKGGTVVYQYQCHQCWESVGPFVSHDVAKKLELKGVVVYAYNKGQQKVQREKTQSVWREEREKKESEREQVRQQWWQEYNQYLNSPKWRAKRFAVLSRANNTCECCLAAKATEVHHLSYANTFNEFLGELAATCGDCHKKAHEGAS